MRRNRDLGEYVTAHLYAPRTVQPEPRLRIEPARDDMSWQRAVLTSAVLLSGFGVVMTLVMMARGVM